MYVANGVEFDGFRNGTLLDAKGQRYEYLLGQKFGDNIKADLLRQANNQEKAAQGFRIEWHVAEKGTASILAEAFRGAGLTSIKVIHTPP